MTLTPGSETRTHRIAAKWAIIVLLTVFGLGMVALPSAMGSSPVLPNARPTPQPVDPLAAPWATTASQEVNSAAGIYSNPRVHIDTAHLATDDLLVDDLDGDGYPDVVAGWGGLYAWRNTGTPFEAGSWVSYTIGLPFYGVAPGEFNAIPRALADLDGSGYPDLITVNRSAPHTIRLWRNNGNPFAGEWQVSNPIAIMPVPVTSVMVADLNDDGQMEIIVAIGEGNDLEAREHYAAIEVLSYEGASPFTGAWTRQRIGVTHCTVNDMALGDLDDDGWDDIVFVTDRAIAVYGEGGTQVSRDEWYDVYQLRALRNPGNSGGDWTVHDLGRDTTEDFTLTVAYHGYWGAHMYSVDLADLDGNGYLDIITGAHGEGDYNAAAWANPGSSNGGPFGGQIWRHTALGLGEHGYYMWDTVRSVAPVDVDANGTIDVVSASDWNEVPQVNVWENTGVPFGVVPTDTHWIRHGVQDMNMHMRAIRVADMNGNGKPDLVAVGLRPDISWETRYFFTWEHRGGAVGHEVDAVAPAAMFEGAQREVMRVTVQHHGTPAEDLALDEWRLRLTNGSGDPLSAAQAAALFQRIAIYYDANGNGVWDATDVSVAEVTSLAPVNGVLTVPFATHPAAVLGPDEEATYLVVVTLRANAAGTAASFGLGFDPERDARMTVLSSAQVAWNRPAASAQAVVGVIASPATVTLVASHDTLPADGVSTAVITATLTSAHGAAVGDGAEVTFTANLGTLPAMPYVATVTGGVATATFTAGRAAGEASVVVTAGTRTEQIALTLQQHGHALYLPIVFRNR